MDPVPLILPVPSTREVGDMWPPGGLLFWLDSRRQYMLGFFFKLIMFRKLIETLYLELHYESFVNADLNFEKKQTNVMTHLTFVAYGVDKVMNFVRKNLW